MHANQTMVKRRRFSIKSVCVAAEWNQVQIQFSRVTLSVLIAMTKNLLVCQSKPQQCCTEGKGYKVKNTCELEITASKVEAFNHTFCFLIFYL